MLEVPDATPEVHMVRDADQAAELELVHSGLLLNFAKRRHFNILSGLLMPLGQVPEAASGNQQIIPTPVRHQSTGGIYFAELAADAAVGLLDVRGRDVNP